LIYFSVIHRSGGVWLVPWVGVPSCCTQLVWTTSPKNY